MDLGPAIELAERRARFRVRSFSVFQFRGVRWETCLRPASRADPEVSQLHRGSLCICRGEREGEKMRDRAKRKVDRPQIKFVWSRSRHFVSKVNGKIRVLTGSLAHPKKTSGSAWTSLREGQSVRGECWRA